MAEAGLPVICIETQHMKSLLKAQHLNKSDGHIARGIAQMIRVGLTAALDGPVTGMMLKSWNLTRDKGLNGFPGIFGPGLETRNAAATFVSAAAFVVRFVIVMRGYS
ncbi:hypothetical protein [Ensifer sp.]|uniref:hypothetical protein n=1 Tax=Ensifer sp. TaxID=1872086 RepID=UPI0039C8ACFB